MRAVSAAVDCQSCYLSGQLFFTLKEAERKSCHPFQLMYNAWQINGEMASLEWIIVSLDWPYYNWNHKLLLLDGPCWADEWRWWNVRWWAHVINISICCLGHVFTLHLLWDADVRVSARELLVVAMGNERRSPRRCQLSRVIQRQTLIKTQSSQHKSALC